jgi:hypothetical protein
LNGAIHTSYFLLLTSYFLIYLSLRRSLALGFHNSIPYPHFIYFPLKAFISLAPFGEPNPVQASQPRRAL